MSTFARRIDRVPLKDTVHQIVQAMILSGELASGTQVDFAALEAQLDVSERPLRESMLVLEGQGYVVVTPRKGTYVATITARDVQDRLEAAAIVAGLAAARAAASASNAPIRSQVARLRADASDDAWAKFLAAVAVASGSRRIQDELESALSGLARRVTPAPRLGRMLSVTLAARIAAAVADGDGAEADKATTRLVLAASEPIEHSLKAILSESDPSDAATDASRTRSAKVEVIEHLRDQIFSGSLRAGERVDLDALASSLKISRFPVREALLVLGQEGLVRTTANRGTFISEFTPTDISDHFEIFARLLEAGAARSIAALGPQELAQLRSARKRLRSATGRQVSENLFLFHRIVERAGTSNWRRRDLRRFVRTLPTWLTAPPQRGMDPRYLSFMDDVIAAVEANDVGALGSLMAAGTRASAPPMIERLRASGFWDDRAAVDQALDSA